MSRGEGVVVALITAAMISIMALWAVLVPIFGSPDEPAHLNSAVRLTQSVSWPAPGDALMYDMVTSARAEADIPAGDRSTFAELDGKIAYPEMVDQMSQHPPLYYAFGAMVLKAIGFMDVRVDVALVALRLAGLIFALPLPALLWSSIRLLTRSPKASVIAAASVLAVPQLANVFAAVSNDGLTILLCSIVVWLSVRIMMGDGRKRVVWALGAALGLALLAKGTSLPFIPFVAVVLLVWPKPVPVARRLVRAAAALLLAFVIGGWWWLRNIILFGDIQPSGLKNSRETVPWSSGAEPNFIDFVDRLWTRASVSFWGNFGWLEYPLPQLLTDVLTVGALLVVALYAFRPGANRLRAIVLTALPLILLLMLVANTWRHYLRTQQFAGMQGRYFFVAIVALVAVSAIAWSRFVAAAARVRVGLALLSTFGLVAVIGIARAYTGEYENGNYRVTTEGIMAWVGTVPGGSASIIAAGGLAAVLGAVSFIFAWRFIRRPAPLHLTPDGSASSEGRTVTRGL